MEAVDRRAILMASACNLGFGRSRAFGGSDRIPGGLRGLVGIGKEPFPPGLLQRSVA